MSAPIVFRNGKRVYGSWAGHPMGVLEDTTCCIEQVFGYRFIPYQCSRKRGHGPEGLYCRQHSRRAEPVSQDKGDC